MILDKTIIGICQIASKDGVRPALSSILLKDGKAIATDGYRLIKVDLPKETDELIADIPTDIGYKPLREDAHLLDAKELEKALKMIPAKASLPILVHAWTAKGNFENSVKIVSTNLTTTNAPDLTEVRVEYPDVKKVEDNLLAKPLVGKIKVNAELLAGLLQAMLKAGVDKNATKEVTLEFRGDMDPLKIVSSEDVERKVEAILMPLRV